MLQIIDLLWPTMLVIGLAAVAAHADLLQTNSGYAQGVAPSTTAATFAASVTSKKPITLLSPPSLPSVGTPPLPTSGHNIGSNVYFPIEKVNKNLISTNDSPSSSGGSSSSSISTSPSNNNNSRRQWQQNHKYAGVNDLGPESDLINSHAAATAPRGYTGPVSASLPIAAKRVTSSSREATNVTIQLNNHAYLNCKLNRTLLQISQVSNKSVSWVRVRDDHILTVNRVTFIGDERFQSFYDAANGAWSLQIKYVQEKDSGLYECQVSTEPKVSAQVQLNVVVPKTEITGDPIRYVKAGSNVVLHCIVREALESPLYISWFYNSHQIYNENSQGWKMTLERNISPLSDSSSPSVTVGESAAGSSSFYHHRPVAAAASRRFKSIGTLIIPTVLKRDSGNYTCSPSNSVAVTVMLHVIHGDYSASAITSSSSRSGLSDFITIIISVAMLNAT